MKMTSVREISFSREIQKNSQIFGFARPFSARSDEINPKSLRKSYVAQSGTRKKFGLLLSPNRQAPSNAEGGTFTREFSGPILLC
jgi:hypothetical protein